MRADLITPTGVERQRPGATTDGSFPALCDTLAWRGLGFLLVFTSKCDADIRRRSCVCLAESNKVIAS